jgi:hypothetical protein
MDCCKDVRYNLIVDKMVAKKIGDVLVSNNILTVDQLDLILAMGKYTNKINLLTFESEYISELTGVLHQNGIINFDIIKQFK